ncbi:Tripeptidyl-peptidase sed2 [Cladobotryum mycophilum]|uniref:tripeptidyl-peptidase II n=1 Tax=Cladobotryum mycophilum TaxID=491253 RepID=A0ABR0SVW7_9HYPO
MASLSLLAAASFLIPLSAASVLVEDVQVVPSVWQQLNHIWTICPLSQDDTRALRAPDADDVDTVIQWLAKNGITEVTPKDDWVHVQTTVAQTEQLLDAKINRYVFEDKFHVLRTKNYTVPNSVSEAISFIHPISNFMTPKRQVMRWQPISEQELQVRDTAPCARVTTPDCIRQLYNINYTTPDKTSSVRFVIAGFLEENANYNDLHQFLKTNAPSIEATGYNFSQEFINGGQNSQDPAKSGGEAALDIDYAMALAYPANISFISTGGRGEQLDKNGQPLQGDDDTNEPYIEFFQHLLTKPNNEIPHVISISYADDELSVPRAYAERVCDLIGLLTARGTSVISGSGDGGAQGTQANSPLACHTNDGSNRDVTMATFPATCPWVTSVGATSNTAEPPAAATFSTGGWSQYFEQPSWQSAAVAGYVKALNGHLQGYYNNSMRAIPDISAIGQKFSVVVGSRPILLDGTSASTPTFASLIALVNDARFRAGKPAIGWLNQILYSDKVKAVLQDITAGQSTSCVFSDGSQPGGFPAKKGWDAITGLGVPKDFSKFLKVLVDA